MKTWIITGGAACGKSYVTALLRDLLGINVAWFSADEVVQLTYKHSGLVALLVEAFGEEIRLFRPSESGELVNRRWIREHVLTDAERRLQLETIIHPYVLSALVDKQKTAVEAQINLLVAEVPLHYEIGTTVLADLVIVVAASRSVQVRRMMENRGLDEHTVQTFLNAQWPIEAKAERADVVIWNDGDISALKAQVLALSGHIRKT